jgi:hypothetical protein
MAARVIRADDADYSFLIKQCSSRINCCSACVWFTVIRPTAGLAKRDSLLSAHRKPSRPDGLAAQG